jgi:hypothetical protein
MRITPDDPTNNSLALNEARAPFVPMLWKLRPGDKTKVEQVWFPGFHSGVGGGDKYRGLSSISLAWMIQKITDNTSLEYNMDYLMASRSTFEPTIDGKPNGVKINEMADLWACTPWVDSFKGVYRFSGHKARTPNLYHKLKEGEKTNEAVHKSVYARKTGLPNYTHPDLSTLTEAPFGQVEKDLSWLPPE